MYVSPLRTEPPLRYEFPSENNMQDSIALICSDLPVLHLEMILAQNTHFQCSKISVQIPTNRLKRTRKRHEPQSLTSALANSQPTHQTLKSPPLLLSVDRFLTLNVASELKIKPSSRQFSGD
jgi:hypothetical protein